CQHTFQVTPRPSSWTGEIRTEIQCSQCKEKFRHKSFPGGIAPAIEKVELLTLSDGRTVYLEDYDTSVDEARAFATIIRAAWEKIPASAREVITRHWRTAGGAPHVWLLNDREEWHGRGWAASSPNGRSLYYLATVATRIPPEHLQLFIAHELGHVLGI